MLRPNINLIYKLLLTTFGVSRFFRLAAGLPGLPFVCFGVLSSPAFSLSFNCKIYSVEIVYIVIIASDLQRTILSSSILNNKF